MRYRETKSCGCSYRKGRHFSVRRYSSNLARQRWTTGRCSCTTRPGNAVSKDKALKPPLQHLQWVGGPRWSRHHDKMSSVSACVSGDGKVFYIFDEGSTYSPYLPCHWTLIARDAFNGVVLWKQPIDRWIGNLYGLKSGPATLPRRLVVAGKRVCATLGIEAPVSVMDADTGEILQTIAGTEGTEEIIHEDGFLYLVADTNEKKDEFENGPRMNYPGSRWIRREKQVLCCDLERGESALVADLRLGRAEYADHVAGQSLFL